ncbi:MAG TPA: glycosyl hydrolase family 28 protein, partial [Myxococcota bacterium]|nr:glycosyl hydrolase family 28 protein [Myxococcota bacterium]
MLRDFKWLVVCVALISFGGGCGGREADVDAVGDIIEEVAPGDEGNPTDLSTDPGRDGGDQADGGNAEMPVDVADDDGDVVQPKICSVRAHGAVGDGVTLDTAALQAAIDECAGTGGVTVVEPGIYYTGTIFIKSDMTFRISEGATILGSTAQEDYDGECLVAIRDAENVILEGPGIIDGNGPTWWFWHWIDTSAYRPGKMLQPRNSRNLTFRNLWLTNAAGWHFQ